MILKRLYDEKLAQASYLVGCEATGEALVVDPNRDIEAYVRAAEGEGLRIEHATETHIHADFVSGARELAHRTGARLYLSDEGGADWSYGFAREASAVLLRDGDSFEVGSVRIDALHTPGHTPEHLSFVLTDTAAADRPMGIFTGDFVFVGDVGRPDLLERAARVRGTMEESARALFQSIQRLREWPDHLQIWPGHGAGSACGRSLGAVPQSTLGYERLVNWAFQHGDEDEFVRAVLAGQPEPPRYFAEMKRINREGPRVLGRLPEPERWPASRLPELVDGGAVVLDTRPADDFARGHVPGTLHIPFTRTFTTRAGELLPYDREIYLIVEEGPRLAGVREVVRDLALIGLDRVAASFGTGAVQAWEERRGRLDTIPQMAVGDLARRLVAREVALVDVRTRAEWDAGHIAGALHLPLAELPERLGDVPRRGPVVLQCRAGNRSQVAASYLRAHGWKDVANLAGGFEAWAREGEPVERAV